MFVLSDDGVVTWLRDVFVRGSSGSLVMSVCNKAISESVEPTTCAAASTAGKSARSAAMSFIEFVTAHCCSCAFVGLICSFPSLPVVA
jgi:hypothetical protein